MRKRRDPSDLIDFSDPYVRMLLHQERVLSGEGKKLLHRPDDEKKLTVYGLKEMARRRRAGKVARRARGVNFRRAAVARRLRQKKSRRHAR